MGENLAWFYDVVTIAVIIAFVYLGVKRGFLKTVVLFCGFLIACIGGYFISDYLSPIIYENAIKEPCEEFVDENFSNFDVKTQIRNILNEKDIGIELNSEQLDDIADEIVNSKAGIPQGIINYFQKRNIPLTQENIELINEEFNSEAILSSLEASLNSKLYTLLIEANKLNGKTTDETLTALFSVSSNKFSEEMTRIVVKPVATQVLVVLIFIISFILITLLVKIIANLFGSVNKIPLAGFLNQFLGACFGLCQGMIAVYIIALAINLLIYLTGNELMVINNATIEETKLFVHIYNFKIF